MSFDPAAMTVEIVPAESSRFRHPLLLIHGLWTGGWIWRDFAPYLAHRGWDAWIPSFLSDRGSLDLDDRRRALLELCRELPGPPVVIAHDAGLVVADALAREMVTPAIVAVAPLTRVVGAVGLLPYWRARLGAHRVRPPRRRAARAALHGLAGDDVARLWTDSGTLVRALATRDRPVDGGGAAAGLVVGSPHDVVAPLALCRRVATERGWECDAHEMAGHFPMLGAASTALADRVHRWLVRTLGADLLAWIDDEDAEE